MGDFLRAGALGDDWTSPTTVSMARDIEVELKQLIELPPDDDPVPRRKLLIAIATGVITHLKNNAAAFGIQVPGVVAGGDTVTTNPPTIKVNP